MPVTGAVLSEAAGRCPSQQDEERGEHERNAAVVRAPNRAWLATPSGVKRQRRAEAKRKDLTVLADRDERDRLPAAEAAEVAEALARKAQDQTEAARLQAKGQARAEQEERLESARLEAAARVEAERQTLEEKAAEAERLKAESRGRE